MSSAVKPSTEGDLAAFVLSVVLHGLLLVPLVIGLRQPTPPRPSDLPSSVAMQGNSIEVEAPTPELAAPASPAAEREPTPIDVSSLPAETSPRVMSAPEATDSTATPRPSARAATPSQRPPRKLVAKAASSPGEAAAAAAAALAPASGAPAAGTFGQEALAPGVRRLGYAFTRAIPAATPADSAWRELPAGHVGTIRVEIQIDESNRLVGFRRWSARPGEAEPPAVLTRMIERTVILLRAGQFALSGSNQPGSERLVIDVRLRDEAADEAATNDVVQKRFDGARPGHPGKAYFRYGTGRAFEATISIATK